MHHCTVEIVLAYIFFTFLFNLTRISIRCCLLLYSENEFSYDPNAVKPGHRIFKFRPGCKVKFDVLLVNYEMINIDTCLLASISWDVLVIDEAHRLKNNQSLVSIWRNIYQLFIN